MSWLQRLMPWYDPEEEARRDANTERIEVESTEARSKAVRAAASYQRQDDQRRRDWDRRQRGGDP